MDTTQSSKCNSNFQNHKGNLSEINNSTILYAANGQSNIPAMQNDFSSSFLGKKRGAMANGFAIQNQEFKDQTKCFLCLCLTPQSKMAACQNCSRTFHLSCLNGEEQAFVAKYGPSLYNCFQCRLSTHQMHQINKNHFDFNEDPYGLFMRFQPANGDDDQQQYKMPFISSGRIPEKQSYQMNNNTIYFNTILAQVMNNKSMNNEQRLNYLLQNSNFQFNLHPLILKVLKDRENGYSNVRNSFDFHLKEIRKKPIGNQMASITPTPVTPSLMPTMQKFPIEDRLLFESSNEYDLDKEIWNRPQGDKIDLEFNICNKGIIAWDFLVTFNEALSYEDIQFEIRTNFDAFYTDIISIGEKSNELYHNIIIAICHLLVKYLKVFDLNDDNKEIYIIKSLINNSNSPARETFSDCLYEVLRILTSCSTYSSLCNGTFIKVLQKAIEGKDLSLLNPEERIVFLHGMINLAYETNMIKNTVRTEFEKSASLSNEKTILEENLKNTEKRKREITRSESFDNINTQINDLVAKLDEINNNSSSTPEEKKKINEIEKQLQINQSLLKENETLEERKRELIEKIKKTKDSLLSLKVPRKKFLGVDYLSNEYYYFNCSVGKLYIKSKSTKQWLLISKRDDIELLCRKLTEKGIKERELKSYIKRILHEMAQKESKETIVKDNQDTTSNINNSNHKEENDKAEQGTEMDSDKAKIESTVNNDNEKTVTDNMNIENNSRSQIASILIKMERKISEYLKQFNKEWECPEMREKWKQILQQTTNEANYISTLRMFNHRFKNPYKSDIEVNEEDEEMSYEVPEATEKFLFYDDENNEVLVIYETDPNKVLSPKVKIWPKEVELNCVDEYYTNELLASLNNDRGKLLLALHFYEDVIFGLIKRRENKKISHNVMTNLLPFELAKR